VGKASFHPSYFIPCHLSVTYGTAPRWFPCIYFWLMTCQHHCLVQCHSALPDHLATDIRGEEKRRASYQDFCIVFTVDNFPFEVSHDHLTSEHHHHTFLQPKMFIMRKHKASVSIVFVWRSKTPPAANKFSRWHKVPNVPSTSDGFSILHSRPNLPNTITSISPEGPPSPFIVQKHPRPWAHRMKLNDFEEFQS